jgi:hypothetical protein
MMNDISFMNVYNNLCDRRNDFVIHSPLTKPSMISSRNDSHPLLKCVFLYAIRKVKKLAVKIATMLPGPVYARLWKLPRLKASALEACIENVPPKDKRHASKS